MITLDPCDPVQRGWLRDYAAWSIHTELWTTGHGEQLGTFHDSSSSITLRLTEREATSLRRALSGLGGVERLLDRDRERRRARRRER